MRKIKIQSIRIKDWTPNRELPELPIIVIRLCGLFPEVLTLLSKSD